MASIVAAMGLPHTPYFPSTVARDDPADETSRLYSELSGRLRRAQVDAIVMFDSDHFNTFFLDNWPTFAIGVASSTSGPNDGTAGIAPTSIDVPLDLARAVHHHMLGNGFDVAVSRSFTVDHSVLVPLHYLTTNAAVLPVFVNGLAPPLPTADRCAGFGRTVADAVREMPGDARVALVASGSFSAEVGGPVLYPGQLFGVPDKDWAARIMKYLETADIEGLVAAATPEQLRRAGNVSGEIFNWIAVAAVCQRPPQTLTAQERLGHAFAWWDIEEET